MDTVKNRLKAYISYRGIGQAKFEKICGLANGYVNNIRQSITPEKLQKIALSCPDLNTGWLITGEGNMLVSNKYSEEFVQRINQILKDFGDVSSDVLTYSLRISTLDFPQLILGYDLPSEPIDLVKFIREFPEYDYRWIISGEGNRFRENEQHALLKIKSRISSNGLAYYSDSPEHKNGHSFEEASGSILREQILFQNGQLIEKDAQIKEKDAQIKQLLDILQKK